MTTTFDLDAIHLDSGGHDTPDDGMCVMEAVSLAAGEKFTATPDCASKVIGAFLMSWNDALPDDNRQNLKQYILPTVGTDGPPEVENARAWMAMDWLVREYTPAWLRLAGLTEHADRLAGLPEFRAGMDVSSIRPAIDAAQADARAARAAARAAARDAAGAAARAAARDAAGAAARAAARDAAGAAAWDAAGAAAWDAARDAAGAAAWAAAGAAARAAAWDAAGAAARAAAGAAAWDAARDAAGAAAWDAARDAARDALTPTVTELQASAHGLVDRMIKAGSS